MLIHVVTRTELGLTLHQLRGRQLSHSLQPCRNPTRSGHRPNSPSVASSLPSPGLLFTFFPGQCIILPVVAMPLLGFSGWTIDDRWCPVRRWGMMFMLARSAGSSFQRSGCRLGWGGVLGWAGLGWHVHGRGSTEQRCPLLVNTAPLDNTAHDFQSEVLLG